MKSGRLEVICGSMFSGKSEELIRRLRRAEFARSQVQVFKHQLDQRATVDHVHAHSGSRIAAAAVTCATEVESLIDTHTQVIGIDEVQFFAQDIIAVVMRLVDKGVRVVAAGLDIDFRGVPFGCMPALLAVADEITKLKAVCLLCGQDARFTQRLVNGRPATKSDPLVLIGAEECYQARCRSCYELAV